MKQARLIVREVGAGVAGWKKEAARLGLKKAEIDRTASAFEHHDRKAAS